MTGVRTLAAHDLVELRCPRPETERSEIGIAIGRAIDETLSRFSHEAAQGRKPTASAMLRFGTERLDSALAEAVEIPTSEARIELDRQLAGVLPAFRRSPLFGLSRPKSRLVLIGEEAGFYAQPDFWDGRARFYEMKSYHAIPPPPDVDLQLALFQLAFPGLQGSLVCFARHSTPVETRQLDLPPLSAARATELLRFAHACALERGTERVLQYVANPIVRYPLPGPGG